MRRHNFPGRWLILPALALLTCSEGPSSPSPVGRIGTGALDGVAAATAAGDVKVGTGAIDIVRLRMDRQFPAGVSVLRQYALAGASYPMNAGETIELWAEWDPAATPRNPRLIVDWGEGEADFTGCGSCRLTHLYRNRQIYRVTARLDDLSGTSIARSFSLDAREAVSDRTGPANLQLEAQVDGRSHIVLSAGQLWWRHYDAAAPGRYNEVASAFLVNGAPWLPSWPDVPNYQNRDCGGCESSRLTSGFSPLAAIAQTVSVSVLQGRGTVSVVQQPSASNGFTFIAQINDPAGGWAIYRLEFAYQTPAP